MTGEKDTTLIDRLRRLREAKGGAFGVRALKHGGSVKAVCFLN